MKKLSKRVWAIVLAVVMTLAPAFGAGVATFAADDTSGALVYTGDEVTFVKADGAGFGMWSPQEGTTCELSGENVVIHYVPKNTTTYAGFSWTTIDKIPNDPETQPAYDVAATDAGLLDFTVSADQCGTLVPVAPIKNEYTSGKSGVPSWTTADQYYLAIPAKEKIPSKPVDPEAIELTIENGVKMFKPEAVSVSEAEEGYVIHLTLGSDAMDKVFIGDAVDANKDDTGAIDIIPANGKGKVDIPVASILSPIALSFHSVKNNTYYNRYVAIDLATTTAVFYPGEITLDLFDTISVEGALNTAHLLTTPAVVEEMIEVLEELQVKTASGDKYCALVKPYYEALSDADKEEVEEAGYLTDDTGDADLDDPRNQDDIGEKELLVVSFGTSFNDSRVEDIKAVEDALAEKHPEYSVRRAFTAQIIINHIMARDGEEIDNMKQALDRAVKNKVKELVVQPTHLMSGAEYDEMCEVLEGYKDAFKITIGKPLLDSDADKTWVAIALTAQTLTDSGYEDLEEAVEDKCAFVYMGHGTAHEAKATYTAMQETFDGLGATNIFVGTVEGEPEETEVHNVLKKVQDAGFTKVILRPLMVVAGDHANNDMAGDEEDSWKSIFSEALGEENVTCQISGLGRIDFVQMLYNLHVDEALKNADTIQLEITNNVKMFKPEALSVTTLLGGNILHLTMGSESYDKVFVGYASEATAEEAIDIELIGGKGYVDIPVQYIGEPIVLAFHSAKNDEFYNRTLTIDLEKKTAVFDPTEITIDVIDDMTTEEAIAHAKDFATVDLVNALIEAIQVQVRTENTDKYCAVARAYYDALSDADKEKLDDPGYFGDDTGDASKDNPRNTAPDKKTELLVVSFGTSFNDNRVATINAIETALEKAYPEFATRRAFTAQIIINHVQARDAEFINNMEQALELAVEEGVDELIVQPTHLMHGAEYDEMELMLNSYVYAFDKIVIAEPLLGEVGKTATDVNEDKAIVAKAVVEDAFKALGGADKAAQAGTALVLMGHGTAHPANITYLQMQTQMGLLGYKNVFVGTVEGEPEGTDAESMIEKVHAAGYKNVILRPLMVVAGDHANNDMADPEDPESWYSQFTASGFFNKVDCQIKGLGELAEVQQLYVKHVADAITPVYQPGWNLVDGRWYYADQTGQLISGWVFYNGAWYYMDTVNYAMVTGWDYIDGVWYFMDESGAMRTGWLLGFDGNWYFFNNSGAMVTGWLNIGGVWYFFKPNGIMAANEWYGGYWLSANGAWTYPYIGSWRENAVGWWFGDTAGWYAKGEIVTINGTDRRFGNDGYWIPEN